MSMPMMTSMSLWRIIFATRTIENMTLLGRPILIKVAGRSKRIAAYAYVYRAN